MYARFLIGLGRSTYSAYSRGVAFYITCYIADLGNWAKYILTEYHVNSIDIIKVGNMHEKLKQVGFFQIHANTCKETMQVGH